MDSAALSGRAGVPVLFREVKRQIIADIQSGAVAPGAALASESELGRRFEVSIGTVRRAVDELVAENILVRQQGRGTFVAKLDRDRFMYQFFRIAARDGAREFPQVKLLSLARARAGATEASALGLALGEPVIRIQNLLSLKRRPVVHDFIVVSGVMFPDLDRKLFEQREGTIYELYQSRYGITVGAGDERVRAEGADAISARLLGLATGQSVLRIERVARSLDAKPVEWRISIVDTRDFDYVSTLQRLS